MTPTAGGRPTSIVDPRGRSKAYRPLPPAERAAAVARGLAAYERGAFYLAHEELEPAWMGTDDPVERELVAGLIKVAAAFVHAARGNVTGVGANLRGARERLARALAAGADGGLDVPALLAAVEARLAIVEAMPALPPAPRGTLAEPPHDVAGPAGRARRPPLDVEPPPIARRTPA